MKVQAIIAAFLGLSFASAQSISLSSLIKTKELLVKPVETPVLSSETVDSDFLDYKLELNDSYLPCQGKDNCGEAKSFQTEKEFNDFISQYGENNQDYLIKNTAFSVLPQPVMMEAQSMSMANTFSSSISSSNKMAYSSPVAQNRDFSGTNNQVDGVDEADLLKTDGTYIYTISGKKLSIILAYPATKASVVSTIDLGNDLNAAALFVEGNYLALFGTDYSSSRPYTYVKIYNVRNRAQPYLERTFKMEGSYTNGRKTSNGYVYLVANQYFYNRMTPWFDFGVGQTKIAWNNIFYYPGKYNSPQLTNILSFNLGSPTSTDRKVVSICGETSSVMYMSERSIYLTSSTYTNGQEWTKIKKIFVNRRHIIPFADGQVRGTVNNQFSLDEYGPYFRIATTSNGVKGTENNVYTLGFALQSHGALTGIAPTERIFSARFMGRRLYLVTFRQIDPFFVISLANHKKPVVLGELKIPGFSRYLHPYDENTIVGLGRQADESGRQLGLKISVFDVKDCKNPRELNKGLELEDTTASSTAEWEHKAFLLSPEKNLMVIPVANSVGTKFNGVLAIHIDKKEICVKGVIDHLSTTNDNFYQRNVERSLYIENLLYTKSKCLLKINSILNDFSDVKDIKIPCEDQYQEPYPIKTPIFTTMPVRSIDVMEVEPQILVRSPGASIAF